LRNQLLLARAQLEAGAAEQAEASLQALLERCQALQFAPLGCEVRLALAATWYALGRAEAGQLERQALEQAERLGMLGLLRDHPSSDNTAPAASDQGSLLSQRERAVLQLLAEGFSNQEIGTYLFISVNTVKTHTKKINSKLGVKRRTQAVMRAKTLGLLV
jgi:ATP/maltotriose-dependent transcriptional regulator MalT